MRGGATSKGVRAKSTTHSYGQTCLFPIRISHLFEHIKQIFSNMILSFISFQTHVNNVNIHRDILQLSVVHLRLLWVTIEMNIDADPVLRLNITKVGLIDS